MVRGRPLIFGKPYVAVGNYKKVENLCDGVLLRR